MHGKVARVARKRGIQVITSHEAGNLGANDDIHFAYAVEHNYVLVTANIVDYLSLFNQWLAEGKTHPGLVLINSEHIKNYILIANELQLVALAGEPEDMRNRTWWI